ncbi:hypothetical protein E4631_03020 [Hymenobacter sp. UV11]|uniref:DUF6364 family protein n=1 Tax=Hymenobacter sp. UV11 TaxID=1849735 RepID=UPI00105F842E|nr:DUF6364 family protein [Hymenobacter sp. UV11]TDN38418.1 hypothetical protein A8B98_23990 [Hymenobacter sp. UV11]TFZ67979.1 hypothetical protein E4631_03020 [Hymenobacter sp. UV11]
MSQLTITLDDNLLQAAQEYARRNGQELNAWVAQLLAEAMQPATDAPADQPARPLSPRIQRLFGAVKVPADFDYKKVLDEAMRERYGI